MIRSLVIGGSVAALASATALAAVGHDVTIAERRTSFEDGGAGILFDPIVVNDLRALNPKSDADLPVSVATRRREMSVGQGGDIQTNHFLPGQTRTAAWTDLHRFLAALAPKTIAHRYIESLTVTDDAVLVPELGAFDVVILADGYHSKHRDLVSERIEPDYNRSVLWRGLFPLNESVPTDVSVFFDDAFSVVSGYPDHFVSYTIRNPKGDGLLANWGWYVETDYDQLSEWFKGTDGSFNARSISPDKVSYDVRRDC